MADWNSKIIEEFRANGGKVGGPFQGAPLLLLHTVGARTGQPRVRISRAVAVIPAYSCTLTCSSYQGPSRSPGGLPADPAVVLTADQVNTLLQRAAAATASFEAARMRLGFAGLDRARRATDVSPMPGLAVAAARRNK